MSVARGDLVTFTLGKDTASGEVTEDVGSGTFLVLVTELGHPMFGQSVYFNGGYLSPVKVKGKEKH